MRINQKANPSHARGTRRVIIDALEHRRMLTATFTGSNDFTDNFRVSIASDSVRVSIDGGPEQVTTDNSIVLDGLFCGQGDSFEFFELPGGTRTVPLSILVKGTGALHEVSFGSDASRMNLDKLNTVLTVDFPNDEYDAHVFDNDDAAVAGDFIVHTLAAPVRQVMRKGSSQVQLVRYATRASIHAHGDDTNDIFSIAGFTDFNGARIYGGGGDDLVHTINFGSNNHDNDLDAIFNSFAGFGLEGGPGVDTLDLDDAADQTGDGDSAYSVVSDRLSKPSGLGVSFGDAEKVYIGGDADANRFLVKLNSEGSITINGGLGNDTYSNHSIGSPDDLAEDIAKGGGFFGAAGVDSIELYNNDGPTTAYTFEPESLTLRYPSPNLPKTFEYDSTTENFLLEQNDFDSTTDLDGKPASMALTINAYGGNDRFNVGDGDIDSNGIRSITLVGGAGTDPIRFEDHFDADSAGETETYAFDLFALAKGSAGLSYSSFESQTLDVADGSQFSTAPTINLNTISGQIDNTTINGGNSRAGIINVGNGSLTSIGGSLDINFGAARGTINFNDASATVARSYQLSATEMTSPWPITFSGASALNLIGGPLDDNFFITGSAAGTAVRASGNLGDDVIRVGGGDFGNMLSAVTVSGNGGDDFVSFNNTSDADFFIATLRNNSFITGGLAHSYVTFENVDIRGGPGGSELLIQSVPVLTLPAISLTNFSGDSGDDRVTVGTGNVLVGGNITVTGSSGNDTLVLDDSSGTSASSYTFDQGNRFFKTFAPVMLTVVRSGFEQTILDANGGNNTITVDRTTSALTILSNGGNDTVNVLDSTVPVTVNTGSENVSATAPFGDSIAVNADFAVAGDTAATVLVDQTDAVLGLNVSQLGMLRIAEGGVLDKLAGTGGAFTLAGTIDLAGGALLSRAGGTSLASFQAMLTRGHNGGAWNGTDPGGAINSSLAAASPSGDGVGYGLGSQIAPTSIGSFSIGIADTLVRYTLDGDANLSGNVNLSDFNRLAANFGQVNRAWVDGNSNYDGLVNLADFNALAGTFGAALSPQTSAAAAARAAGLREGLEELS